MGKIDLDELEQLAAQATPGPWEVDGTTEHNGRYTRQSLYLIVDGWQRGTLSNEFEEEKKDAAYIVAACNAVPELIAENRALQERAQMRQELVEQYEQDIARLRQKVRELEAELATYKQPIDFPKLRESVASVDNSLSDFLEDAIKRAAHRP